MTTLYIPRLIESAEQAEALPVGTLAIGAREDGTVVEAHLRKHPEGWVMTGLTGDTNPQLLVGWSALVPTEAVAITRQTRLCEPGRTTRYIAEIQEDQ